jgi:hypothetical protein
MQPSRNSPYFQRNTWFGKFKPRDKDKGARLSNCDTTALILLCQYKNEGTAKCSWLSGLRGGPGVGLAGFDEGEVGR